MMEQNIVTLKDYKEIIKRRKWPMIIPAVLIFLAACTFAFLLPAIYKSTSTILVEDQEVPENYVVSSVGSYAEKRIENIRQRIMSTTQLIDIINKIGLYQELKDKYTTNRIVEHMRDDISLEPISTEVFNKRTGRSNSITTAFTISYEGKDDPEAILKVTSMLTSLFLTENLKDRERQARETSTFLEDEKNRLKFHLAEIDAKIASFKEKHINELPEVFQMNIQVLADIQRKMEQLDQQLTNLREREGYLETQMAGIPLDEESNNQKRINELKLQLTHLLTTYSEYYPDVIKVKKEIVKLEKKIKEIKNERRDMRDNSSYVVLASQLNRIRNDIRSLKRQKADLEKQKKVYQKRIQSTPRVEEEYLALVSERKSAQAKYDDLTMKAMEAKVAQGLETEQKGEKFTLLDPPRLPEKPYKPNRFAIILIGVLLGTSAGVGMASFMEFSDNTVRTPEDLGRLAGFPVLSEIPEIITPLDIKRMKQRRRILINGSIVVLAIIIGIFFTLRHGF